MQNFFLLIITFLFLNLSGQEVQDSIVKKNSVSLELGGAGLYYSLNYDRLLVVDQKMRFSVSAGTWYIPQIDRLSDFQSIIGLSISFNTLFGRKKHFGEIGFGFSYLNLNEGDGYMYHTTYLPFRLGYRFQKDSGGLLLRAFLMPLVPIYQNPDVKIFDPIDIHYGVAVGYVF